VQLADIPVLQSATRSPYHVSRKLGTATHTLSIRRRTQARHVALFAPVLDPPVSIGSLFWRTNVNKVWRRQRTCVTNYVDQQTTKSDDDKANVLPHQRLWIFKILVYLSTAIAPSLLPPQPSPSSAAVLNHLFSLSYAAFRRLLTFVITFIGTVENHGNRDFRQMPRIP